MSEEERQYCIHLLHYFKIEGEFADEMASEGQLEIFYELIFRPHKRLQILCSTQYGKSLFVALACICIACLQHEMVAIIAPTQEKAKIIMRYFVEHLGDDPIFTQELEKNSKLDRLRMEETKERITMKRGGGIFIISVQAGNTKKGVEAAMGAGARIVIQDESALIPDNIESTVFRMIAGKGEQAFYCKIGNPFYRNHFLRSFEDPTYHQVFIDASRGLAEGRYTAFFLAEARKKPLYGILYDCKFPGEGMVDERGFLSLIPASRIIVASKMPDMKTVWFGRKILGIDPSGEGKDEATFAIRDRFRSEIVAALQSTNPREVAQVGLTIAAELEIAPEDIVIDSFGIGSDVGKEMALASKGKIEAYTVLLGNKPADEEDYNKRFFRRRANEVENSDEKPNEWDDIYLNLRALMYFRLREWLLSGGTLIDEDVDNSAFKEEVSVIKYKRSLHGNTIQLMSKKDMLALGIPSPNKADALALTMLRELDDVSTRQSKEEREAILAEESRVEDRHSVF